MGKRERSNDPSTEVEIDGWLDLLDEEAEAPRSSQPSPVVNPQPTNLSALNEISNKVTPVMLAPVHHLLPTIEPSHPTAEPRDVWEADVSVGDELGSFFAVPPANAAPRIERRSEPDPLPPLMEKADPKGEEFLDFGDLASAPPRAVDDDNGPEISGGSALVSTGLTFDDLGEDVEFEPAQAQPVMPFAPAPAASAAMADLSPAPSRAMTPAPGPLPAAMPPLPTSTGARTASAKLPDPAQISTSTRLPETLLAPSAAPPPDDASDFDLSDFDRWGRDDDEVTPAAGFQAFPSAGAFTSPPDHPAFAEAVTRPRPEALEPSREPPPHEMGARAMTGPQSIPPRPNARTMTWADTAPEAPSSRPPGPSSMPAPPFSVPPPPSMPASQSDRPSGPPAAPGTASWNRPASPSRRPTLAHSVHEAPTPVRPPPLPHLMESSRSVPPPPMPAPRPEASPTASSSEAVTPARPMPAVQPKPAPTPPRAAPAPAASTPKPTPPRPMPALTPKPTASNGSPPKPVPAAPPPRRISPSQEMHERFDLGDFTGALNTAETLLEVDPDDRDAKHIAEVCRAKLRAIYIGRLGSLDQVPVLAVAPSEFRWLSLDHRAGFLLSLIDGASTLEDVIDVSAMSQLEALRTLYNLMTQQIITLRKR